MPNDVILLLAETGVGARVSAYLAMETVTEVLFAILF